jgi:hypothetical protein
MRKVGRVVRATLILAAASGLPAAALAASQEPVPVVAAERAGVHVRGTVGAAQAGSWAVGIVGTPTVALAAGATVNAAPRRVFRGTIPGLGSIQNDTSDLLVIDLVSGYATELEPYFQFELVGAQGGIQARYPFPATTLGVYRMVNAMTQIHLSPGDQLDLINSNMTAYVSGHYEPMPQP